jgi:hypothetical protein
MGELCGRAAAAAGMRTTMDGIEASQIRCTQPLDPFCDTHTSIEPIIGQSTCVWIHMYKLYGLTP